MKKILEVLRYGDGDIRFNTDVDPVKQPKEVADLLSQIVMTMATKLWEGTSWLYWLLFVFLQLQI